MTRRTVPKAKWAINLHSRVYGTGSSGSDGRTAAIFEWPHRFQPLAKELVAMQSDLIVAQTPPVVAAVRQETGVIPLVFVDVSDPIGAGFVGSLAQPGGHMTGLLIFEKGIVGKWLAMLKEIAPSLTRVALMGNPKTTARLVTVGDLSDSGLVLPRIQPQYCIAIS